MWAVVPFKPLGEAKRRLDDVLSAQERRGLALAMLEDVLTALTRVNGLAGTLIVTREPEAKSLAGHAGVRLLEEPAPSDLNLAVTMSARMLVAEGRTGMLVVPSDLPLVRPADIERILATLDTRPAVTLVTDRRGTGSNAVACTPPDAMPFHFGAGSLRRHLEAASKLGITPTLLKASRLEFDIDLPSDVAEFLEISTSTRTARYLVEAGISEQAPSWRKSRRRAS